MEGGTETETEYFAALVGDTLSNKTWPKSYNLFFTLLGDDRADYYCWKSELYLLK